MEFRNMTKEMTEQEIKMALYIVYHDAVLKRYQRMSDCIKVWYSLPNDLEDAEHSLELLPDDIYYVDDNDKMIEQPETDGDVLFYYSQLMVAKGYSTVWKGNPFVL